MTNEASAEKLSVFLTGGTGFVGRHVARHLAERGHAVRALVRDPGSAGALREIGAELVQGDVAQESALDDAVAGCDTVIHLVGIIRERLPAQTFENIHTRGTSRVADAARRAEVHKLVYMSALGAKPDGTAYQRTKHYAEEVVRRSEVPFVIFRPSLIVGPDGEFMRLLLRLLRLLPVTPVIGDGQYRLQPVDVEDVATAFVQAAERQDLNGECFEIGGPHKLTYNRILDIICEEFRLRSRRIHVAPRFVRPFVEFAASWRLPTPVTPDELTMLFEESIVPGEKNTLRESFGFDPTSLRSVLQRFPQVRRSA